MHLRSTIPGLLFIAACSLPLAAHADPRYKITVVGDAGSDALGINSGGDVVGFLTSPGADHAFVYSGGAMSDIGTLGGSSSRAYAINDSGIVVGGADNAGNTLRAFTYSGGAMSDLGTLGGARSTAYAINNAGQVVGSALTATDQDRAFLYSGGTMHNLGTLPSTIEMYSSAYAISNTGLIGGNSSAGEFSLPEPPSHAFMYAGGVMTDLGTFGGQYSVALGVNDLGQLVGIAATGELHYDDAFLYEGGVLKSLGTLPGGSYAFANDINNLGQIIGGSNSALGQHAFLYEGGAMVDLNALIDPLSGWEITDANSINDGQQIAGMACKAGVCYAVRLDLINAVPEPFTYAMLLGGLGLLGVQARRRSGYGAAV